MTAITHGCKEVTLTFIKMTAHITIKCVDKDTFGQHQEHSVHVTVRLCDGPKTDRKWLYLVAPSSRDLPRSMTALVCQDMRTNISCKINPSKRGFIRCSPVMTSLTLIVWPETVTDTAGSQ